MRKVSLVLLALIVAAGTAFASDVTISGVVAAGWGFGDGVYEGLRERGEIKVTAVVDEINTAVINMRSNDGAAPEVRDAYLTTNLGAAFGLEGQTLMVKAGRYENDAFLGNITGIEFENVADIGERDAHVQLEYAYGELVKFRGVITPGDGDAMAGFFGVKANVGPAAVELFYSDAGSPGMFGDVEDLLTDPAAEGGLGLTIPARETGQGFVGLGVQGGAPVVPDTLTLTGSAEFAYDLYFESFVLGAGVKAEALDMVTFGVSFEGHGEVAGYPDTDFEDDLGTGGPAEASLFNRLGLDLNIEPVPFAGIDLAVVLGLQSTSDSDFVPFGYEETLQYLEPSFYLKAGAATYRLGYAFYNADAADLATLIADGWLPMAIATPQGDLVTIIVRSNLEVVDWGMAFVQNDLASIEEEVARRATDGYSLWAMSNWDGQAWLFFVAEPENAPDRSIRFAQFEDEPDTYSSGIDQAVREGWYPWAFTANANDDTVTIAFTQSTETGE